MTLMTNWEALNHGMYARLSREERYKKADEFAALMEKLFLSWNQAAFLANRSTNRLIEHERIQAIDHSGAYFSVKGPLSTLRKSPRKASIDASVGF